MTRFPRRPPATRSRIPYRHAAAIWLITVALVATVLVTVRSVLTASDVRSSERYITDDEDRDISPMGAIARGDVPAPTVNEFRGRAPVVPRAPSVFSGLQGEDRLVHSPTAPDFQSETTIAKYLNFVVVGYNDIRGFSLPDVSVSGWAFSTDGGLNWTDGGQLPTLGGDRVSGDPDVKTWSDPQSSDFYFFYSSLYATTGGQASLCLHVSTDGGQTWSNPREVTTATSSTDFPDKEFIGVDPETGRIFIAWRNFQGGTDVIKTTYSDDFGITWQGLRSFINVGQGAIPRADGSSDNVYIAWRRNADIQFVRSTDNGVSWGSPSAIPGATGLTIPMNPYGSDRINGFPAMDIDHENGNIYLVYASRNLAPDFSDIYFIRSTDGGTSWSVPVAINASPGSDRSQFFPWVSVDQSDGRIDAIWFDQINGAGTSDITDVFHTHSSDGGVTWSCPTPLTDDRFHAEYGNRTSQPNIGDYIQSVSENGVLYTAFAKTDDPSHLTFAPDTYVDIHAVSPADAPLSLRSVNLYDAGCRHNNGFIEPSETIALTLSVENYSDCAPSITAILGTLSTSSPGVTVTTALSAYPNLGGAGSFASNLTPFEAVVDTTFPCGEPIEFLLTLQTLDGNALVPFEFSTGTPMDSLLLTEDFDGVTAPALPAGWSSDNLGGIENPWVTSTTFAESGANSAFCADVSATSHNRLTSPFIEVPVDCDLLDVTFDVTHDIEDDVERRVWDGALLRIEIDDGMDVEVELAGSFASLFEPFYPWQLNRQASATQPLQDLSCWSSDVTPNFNSVHLQFPGLAGKTVRLFFEMGTDGAAGTPTGMFVDNVVVASIEKVCDCTDPTGINVSRVTDAFEILSVSPNPFNPSTTVRFVLPRRTAVTAEVYGVDGRRIRTLARDRPFGPGENLLQWNGLDTNGTPVSSGVYFVRIRTDLGSEVARAVLLK